jgi:hypothetical protein
VALSSSLRQGAAAWSSPGRHQEPPPACPGRRGVPLELPNCATSSLPPFPLSSSFPCSLSHEQPPAPERVRHGHRLPPPLDATPSSSEHSIVSASMSWLPSQKELAAGACNRHRQPLLPRRSQSSPLSDSAPSGDPCPYWTCRRP